MASEQQWRAAYDQKVSDLASETKRLSLLIAAVEADGHTGEIHTRQFRDCRLCTALRQAKGKS